MTASVPQILKIITLTFGGQSYKEDVVSAQVVNEAGDVQSIITLDGVTHQDASAATWFLELEAVIDWDTTRPGLAYYLFNNEGDTVAVVFDAYDAAISTSKPALNFNVVLVPLPYGGTGNEFATATVRLPITGAITVDTTP